MSGTSINSPWLKGTYDFKKTVITEVGMKHAVKGKSPKEIKGVRSRAAPFYEEFLGGAGPAAPPR